MNKINIRCCLKTIENQFNIHRCDDAIIIIALLCFVILISKFDIIVKQLKFVFESFSRLLKIIVVKTLIALNFYNNFFFKTLVSVFKIVIMIYLMFSKF